MSDNITIDLGPDLVNHYLADSFWSAHDDSWPEYQLANSVELERLNGVELPCYSEELIIELCQHPDITEADHHNFNCCTVITFRARGRYYKFDIWENSFGVHYEASRWSDEPWSG